MAVIAATNVISGAGLGSPLRSAGAPSTGTNEVQTITFGGTPTASSTFYLAFDGLKTAAIPWSATNTTLVANIDAALEALPNIGTGGVTTAVGTMTAGVGTITVTFDGPNVRKQAVSTLVSSVGTYDGTLSVAETTPGVSATGRSSPTGAQCLDTTNGKAYVQTSTTTNAPTWTVTGAQT